MYLFKLGHFMHPIYFISVKYHHVGKVLKDGEEPTEYTDEEDADQKKKN